MRLPVSGVIWPAPCLSVLYFIQPLLFIFCCSIRQPYILCLRCIEADSRTSKAGPIHPSCVARLIAAGRSSSRVHSPRSLWISAKDDSLLSHRFEKFPVNVPIGKKRGTQRSSTSQVAYYGDRNRPQTIAFINFLRVDHGEMANSVEIL